MLRLQTLRNLMTNDRTFCMALCWTANFTLRKFHSMWRIGIKNVTFGKCEIYVWSISIMFLLPVLIYVYVCKIMSDMWRIGIECKCSRFGGLFVNVKNTHVCYTEFDFVRIFHKVWGIDTKYVMYRYQFCTCCEELVPIFLSVKFTNCEVFGSTILSYNQSLSIET